MYNVREDGINSFDTFIGDLCKRVLDIKKEEKTFDIIHSIRIHIIGEVIREKVSAENTQKSELFERILFVAF